jgi:hypothetical protein
MLTHAFASLDIRRQEPTIEYDKEHNREEVDEDDVDTADSILVKL